MIECCWSWEVGIATEVHNRSEGRKHERTDLVYIVKEVGRNLRLGLDSVFRNRVQRVGSCSEAT